jgi:hypothetical protein
MSDTRILALDLATFLGFAVGTPEQGVTEFGSHQLPKTGEDAGKFGYAYECWLDSILSRIEPWMMFYEKPSLFKGTTPITVLKLNGLAFVTEIQAHKRKLDVREVNVQDITTHFCGKGSPRMGDARKRHTMKIARARGFEVKNDNEADAIAQCDYALSLINPKHALAATSLPWGAQ